MKRLVLAGLTAAGLSATTSVNAADRLPPAPHYAYWTGFYYGGHVGAGRDEDRATTVGANALIASSTIDSVQANSFLIGGQLGYNYQIGIGVLGVEADGSWTKSAKGVTVPWMV